MALNNNPFDQLQEDNENCGFQNKIYENEDLFELKAFDLKKFPDEKIKIFKSSSKQIIVVTITNRIFRWRYELDDEFIEYEIPEKKDEGNIISTIAGVANLAKDIGKKMLFMNTNKKNTYIEQFFLDVKGYHCIFCSDQGLNFYFGYNQQKIKVLKNIKGDEFTIRSAAFDETCTETNTKNMLLGTTDGVLYIYKIEYQKNTNELIESNPDRILQIPENRPILQIVYFLVQIQQQKQQTKTGLVVLSTSQSLYTFTGTSDLSLLLSKYKQVELEKLEKVTFNPSESSLLDVCYEIDNKGNRSPQSIIWTNGYRLNYYIIPKNQNQFNEKFLSQPSYYRYAKQTDQTEQEKQLKVEQMPIDICLTLYHYFILHQDSLTILSRINEKVVQYFDLKSIGKILGMSFDIENQQIWIYSNRKIQKLIIQNEDKVLLLKIKKNIFMCIYILKKDAWKLYLEKKEYKQAYEISSKNSLEVTEYLSGLYADELFEKRNYVLAAQQYFQTERSFEQITLKFIQGYQNTNEVELNEGLETYLELWLKKLKNEENLKAQKCILLIWLIEIKVQKLNYLEAKYQSKQNQLKKLKEQDELWDRTYNQFLQLNDKFKKTETEFKKLLSDNLNDLEENIVYQIMQSHGRLKDCLEFAQKNSYEMIILHHINEEQYDQALKYLFQIKEKHINEVLYKYCHIFMRYRTEQTIQLLQRYTKYKPQKLIGGLMSIHMEKRDQGINYIQHLLNNGCKDKVIHNILILFLSDPSKKNKLKEHLYQQEKILQEKEQVNFDLEFALRLFRTNKLYSPQIQIYGMMGMYSEAVELALKTNHIQLAKQYADKPINIDCRKKLWLNIAIHLLGKGGNNIDEVIQLTKDTDLLKIEDLLMHFNENIKIENFKKEICESLQEYNKEIEQLQSDMESYSSNADQLKNELRIIKNRYIEIESNHTCEECFKNLFNEAFYVFPCMHAFHKDCLLSKVKESCTDQNKIKQIEKLNKKIEQLQAKMNRVEQRKRDSIDSGFFNFVNIFTGRLSEDDQQQAPVMSPEEERQLEQSRNQFDTILANECIYCGPSIVESIFQPFEQDDDLKESWKI
ncbi:vacuolar sorting protein, putative [Ichthyophthirius multifiliis]|uniref:Vacuolar sorting protein, putative n=1 Tax=Ichthyophthirius multifiliis TaxID=5932 RepID=G0QJ48_ICHMU|nr:vacuolar sorting protein, putative [Ichthyophthirius multifiliis]EGR34772.1 vacuolar sorting protein, putative [Ichthyophthirius multifiliis]|eukprot:XP_004040076.1 vacuolar sorting protein, putative [Ichthyophthirius multifiliis]